MPGRRLRLCTRPLTPMPRLRAGGKQPTSQLGGRSCSRAWSYSPTSRARTLKGWPRRRGTRRNPRTLRGRQVATSASACWSKRTRPTADSDESGRFPEGSALGEKRTTLAGSSANEDTRGASGKNSGRDSSARKSVNGTVHGRQLLGLRGPDVDLTGRAIALQQQLQWLAGEGYIMPAVKSHRSRRPISIVLNWST